uniref:hypothetical protein n=1 Tax=Prosthecobacter sp. TaxID=1965333 RepID=UPI003784D67D
MDRFTSSLKQRLLVLLIVGPLIALIYYFFGDAGMDKFKTIFERLAVALLILVFVYMFWLMWGDRKSKARASVWKQRISSVADSTDEPYEDETLDDFCEFTNQTELVRTLELLEQMPKGQRHLKHAYAEVLKKYGGPS